MSFDLEFGTGAVTVEESAECSACISIWSKVKEFVAPVSHAESIVNEIYSNSARTLQPDPAYNVEDLSQPHVYVQAKAAVKDAVSAVGGFSSKVLIIAGVVILLAIFAHGFAMGFARK